MHVIWGLHITIDTFMHAAIVGIRTMCTIFNWLAVGKVFYNQQIHPLTLKMQI